MKLRWALFAPSCALLGMATVLPGGCSSNSDANPADAGLDVYRCCIQSPDAACCIRRPDAAPDASFFSGGCDGDPNKDCSTSRDMRDYWPAPPVGTFILTDYVQPDGVNCAKRTRYRVGTHPGGTSYVFDEYNCNTGNNIWLTTRYYMFGPTNVSEWRDDYATDGGSNYKSFEAEKAITWGGALTPGVWSGNQTHCVEGNCGTFDAWGWSQIRLDYTLRDFTLNGATYHNVVHVTTQQTVCSNPACTSSYPPVNGGYYLVPSTGGGGHGGFIKQEYYDSSGHHDIKKTCVTTDFNQLACP